MSYRINSKHECPGCGLQMIEQEIHRIKMPKVRFGLTASAFVATALTWGLLSAGFVVDEVETELAETRSELRRLGHQVDEMEIEFEIANEQVSNIMLNDVHIEHDVTRIDRHLFQLRHPATLREYEGPPIIAGPTWACVATDPNFTCVKRIGGPQVVHDVTRGEVSALTYGGGLIDPPHQSFWRRAP